MMKKTVFLVFVAFLVFCLFSCAVSDEDPGEAETTVKENEETDVYDGSVPDDFYFSIRFGTYGESSYDSRDGKLVKSRNATHPEDYVTTLLLSADEMREIYGMIRRININTYPNEYDPINDPESEERIESIPYMTLSLTAKHGSVPKTVYCERVAHGAGGYDEKSRDFLECFFRITEIITDSEEWKVLPDYEVRHE